MSEKKPPMLCTIDFETTGLDKAKDKITEAAFVIRRFGEIKPRFIYHSYLKIGETEIPDEVIALTHITKNHTEGLGVSPFVFLNRFHEHLKEFGVDYIVAHNGRGFDKLFYETHCLALNMEPVTLHWLDTKVDIEWPFKSSSLFYIGAELGFLNPFQHDALSDVLCTEKILVEAERRGIIKDIHSFVEYSLVPEIIIQSSADFHTKDAAKGLGYRFNDRGNKKWEKVIKECNFEKELQAASEVGLTLEVVK